MPLEQIDLGDPHRLAGAGVSRDDVQRQVVPRRGAAGGDDASGGIGQHQVGRGVESHFRVVRAKQILIAPVRRRRAAVEQPGLRQHDRAGARRVERGAGPVTLPQPLHECRMPAVHRLVGPQPQLRQDHDGRGGGRGDVEIRVDGDAVAAGERPRLRGDDPHPEQLPGRLAHQGLPQVSGCGQHVDQAVQCRGRGFGHGHDQDVERLSRVGAWPRPICGTKSTI